MDRLDSADRYGDRWLVEAKARQIGWIIERNGDKPRPQMGEKMNELVDLGLARRPFAGKRPFAACATLQDDSALSMLDVDLLDLLGSQHFLQRDQCSGRSRARPGRGQAKPRRQIRRQPIG